MRNLLPSLSDVICYRYHNNNITRLNKDHKRAKQLAQLLNERSFVSAVQHPKTNIVILTSYKK